jgi:hypothetical protein
MIRAVFIDLYRLRIRDIYWKGGSYPYDLTDLIDPKMIGDRREVIQINGSLIDLILTCGTIDNTRAWRFSIKPLDIFYSPAIILAHEVFTDPFVDNYEKNCPFSALEICTQIDWVRAKVDERNGYKVTEFASRADCSQVE